MKAPDWFKVFWWAFVTIVFTFLLDKHLNALNSGSVNHVDLIVFIVWIGLLFLPLCSEINLFGFKFKQELKELKDFVTNSIQEIRNSSDARANSTNSVHIHQPAPDSILAEIQKELKTAIAQLKPARHEVYYKADKSKSDIPERVMFLSGVRYQLEKELRRIAINRDIITSRRGRSVSLLPYALLDNGILDTRITLALREVYSICSTAMHANDVSDSQVEFVRQTYPELLETLRSIE